MTTYRRILLLLLLAMAALPLSAETWYIRTDGGTRFSAKARTGQCDGKVDAPYPGKGVNRHCAFNDIRYLWDDQTYDNHAWVIAGGDTVIIEGCAANANQLHPDVPHCRIGWDSNSGRGAGYTWCLGIGNIGCQNPPIPAGTATKHTRILGECVVRGTCHTGISTNRANLAQIFGGFGADPTFNLGNTQYVDIEGIELTTHNGVCSRVGSPAYPRGCNSGSPDWDDYSNNGIDTNNMTSNITLRDVYIDGFSGNGLHGPIGGPIIMTRVFVGFNAFAGWNFDDGSSTPDAAGSSITASYVTMEGNGCMEQYPIVNTQFPALACWDSDSGGFGDSWSGQNTKLASFTCDHCVMAYNTKDGFIGPHTVIGHLSITNSKSYGNMGQQWKWGTGPGSAVIFENNLTVGNCGRMSAPLPGAPPDYNRHLSLFCRAAGDVFSFYSAANGSVLFADNTTVGYSATMFDFACQTPGTCGSAHYIFRNNIVLGFLNPKYNPGNAEVPGLFYYSDPSIKLSLDHDNFYNLRTRPCPWFGRPDLICESPEFVNEPPLTLSIESQLDNFNFHPSRNSPAVGHGEPISGLTTDFFGVARPASPSIGAVEP